MKVKTLVTLYTIVGLLIAGVILAKSIKNAETDSSTKYSPGYKPFGTLSPGEISSIELKGANHATTIKVSGDQWVVTERENYPVDVDNLQNLIRKISGLKITQNLEAGETYDTRFGMDSQSEFPEDHGTVITLKRSNGETITSLKIGKDVTSGEAQDPMAMMMGGATSASGKFIRLDDDANSVYVVNDSLPEAKAHPKTWLRSDFLNVVNITSISLSKAGVPDTIEWEVNRSDVNSDFTIKGDIPAGQEVNKSTLNAFKNLLNYARFEDIVSSAAAEGLINKKQTRQAIIKTDDGFTYTLQVSPKTASGTENHLLTVKVHGSFPNTRPVVEGETAEAAVSADEQFAKTLKQHQEKLVKEQALEGRVFEVTNYTVQSLLKSMSDLTQEIGGAPQPARQGGPRSVTTPPFQIGR